MKEALDVDLELDIKAADVAKVCRSSASDVVERVAVGVITLATVGGVVAVFALLLGCCHG